MPSEVGQGQSPVHPSLWAGSKKASSRGILDPAFGDGLGLVDEKGGKHGPCSCPSCHHGHGPLAVWMDGNWNDSIWVFGIMKDLKKEKNRRQLVEMS